MEAVAVIRIEGVTMSRGAVKIGVISACLILSLILFLGGSFIYFSDIPTSIIQGTVGDVYVKLVEDFPSSNELGNSGEMDAATGQVRMPNKMIRGVSAGKESSYVRFKLFPIVEYLYIGVDEGSGARVQEWRTATIPISCVRYDTVYEQGDWIMQHQYWYYTKILHKEDITSAFTVTNVRFENLPQEMAGQRLRLDLSVQMESCDTSPASYLRIFGEDLPAQVERNPG